LRYNVNFQLSENQKTEALKLVIDGAIKDVTNKAKIIANTTNVQLVRIKDIDYGYSDFPYNIIASRDKKYEYPAITPIPIDIKKTIYIIWKIKKFVLRGTQTEKNGIFPL
jgi:uncharacterized protein YggE